MASRAVPRLEFMNEDQCRLIHDKALEVLRHTGVRVHHPEARQLLKDAGAVITDDTLVRIPPGPVEWALKRAPSVVTLCSRGERTSRVRLGGEEVHFGPGSDCLTYMDPEDGQVRPFKTRDLERLYRLVDRMDELSFVMSMGIPGDVEKGTSTYRYQFALMLANTTKPIVFVSDDRADVEAIINMASTVAGGMDELRLNPTLLLYSEPTSPLQHSRTATEKLLYMAETAIPVVHSPAPIMGGTAPVTVAGGMVLGTAEVLSSLLIHQLKRPGAPFVYGTGLNHMDMKTTISVYAAPEFQLSRLATADMARFYRLPSWGYAGHSDSKLMDQQAAEDAFFSVMYALMTRTNLIHDVGYIESGITTSPEMIVYTAECLSQLRHFLSGIPLDENSLAVDAINEVGPGGTFLTHDHTFKGFRWFWQPRLQDRHQREDWARLGEKSLGDRLKERTLELMSEAAEAAEPLAEDVYDRIKELI